LGKTEAKKFFFTFLFEKQTPKILPETNGSLVGSAFARFVSDMAAG
jgi:hypothetical protein